MGGGCGGESARHSEVESEPSIGAKAEEHLFAVGVGGAEMAPLNGAGEEQRSRFRERPASENEDEWR